MDGNQQIRSSADNIAPLARTTPVSWWKRTPFRIIAVLLTLSCLLLLAAAEYLLHNAEPILRRRIVETLAARFHAPVQLDQLSISLLRGIEVNGYGLRIGNSFDSGSSPFAPPLATVQHFSFRTSLRGLLRQPVHVALVRVDGMELHIPPADFRARWQGSAGPQAPGLRPKIAILADEVRCHDLRLILDPGHPPASNTGPARPRKLPLVFNISLLDLVDVGGTTAMRYDAVLTNPKPVGLVHAVGHFGPWANGVANGKPGETPLDGNYSFDHADLSSINGIAGTLSSQGHFGGVLDAITIAGETDIPNFSLDISHRPVPLHTHFRAVVDGSNGDTFLREIHARLGNSEFLTTGQVVKVAPEGHDLQLHVEIPHGDVQDFLRLATRTSPPLMNGTLALRAELHIPPGRQRVAEKLGMAGDFSLTGVRFNNPRLQSRVDGLSLRAQERPDQASLASQQQGSSGPLQLAARSQLAGRFILNRGVMAITGITYAIPGATVLLNGVYSLDGRLFEFRGHVRTQATASQMVGGWKGMLLKPLDSLLEKHGAGLELPIEVSGTEGDVHLGLAPQNADSTPAQLLADVQSKQKAKVEMGTARQAAAQADREDQQAAHATTLAEAERLHQAAVRHRAEAQRGALAARDGISPHP